ncbi:MAG: hypothetical protein FK732_10605 [Asgard group archaeon]|nr:hypothetical protein [Asgard group archaeon]
MADAISIIQLIATILGMGSIIVGVIFSLLAIQRNNRARNLSLFMQYYNRSLNVQFLENLVEINDMWSFTDIDDFWKKYGSPASIAKFLSVASYYDSMGMLLKTKNITVEYIPELMLVAVCDFWEKFETIYKDMPAVTIRPESFDNIKYLYDEIRKMNK